MNDLSIACHSSVWIPARTVAPRSAFAIGDIHGRIDLLSALHREIRSIATADSLSDPLVIHLGDYIDRGPQSLACLEMALDGLPGIETVCLPGNHEQMMRHAIEAEGADRDKTLEMWLLWNGGASVATELGMRDGVVAVQNADQFLRRLQERLGQRLGRFRAMSNHVRLGDYLFVHAGINPTLSLAEQLGKPWGKLAEDEDEDPLWVRGPFLLHDRTFEDGLTVVHGHTIRDRPQVRANRIGIDTGAYRSGLLTCLELRGDQLRFITAIGSPSRLPEPARRSAAAF